MIWESNSSLLVKIELIPTLLLEREGLVGINNFYICHSDEVRISKRSRIEPGMTMVSKSTFKCHSDEGQNLRDA